MKNVVSNIGHLKMKKKINNVMRISTYYHLNSYKSLIRYHFLQPPIKHLLHVDDYGNPPCSELQEGINERSHGPTIHSVGKLVPRDHVEEVKFGSLCICHVNIAPISQTTHPIGMLITIFVNLRLSLVSN